MQNIQNQLDMYTNSIYEHFKLKMEQYSDRNRTQKEFYCIFDYCINNWC